jgi:hypothetical protein
MSRLFAAQIHRRALNSDHQRKMRRQKLAVGCTVKYVNINSQYVLDECANPFYGAT